MRDESGNVNGEPSPRSVASATPWSGMEILVAAYLIFLFWPFVASELVWLLGVKQWYYGGDAAGLSERLTLWMRALAWPPQLLTFPLVFAALSNTRLPQLGLTTRRLGRNVLAGVVGTLILTPLVYAVYWSVRYLYSLYGEGVESHVIEDIAQQALFPFEWVLLIFMATVAAPSLEELTFRGVLQPWLAQRRWGGHAAMLGALAFAVVLRKSDLYAAWPQGMPSLALAAAPALFVLALTPIYLLLCWRGRTPVGAAIFGTSLLFACVHASVWPTPIPLFVLALGLGMLAHRSQSLVGPIVLHALFNGISCVQLLLEKSN